jgi:ACS family glucarate transporter-like MFS transporter
MGIAVSVVGIIAWLAVKPDVPLVLKENNNLEKIA